MSKPDNQPNFYILKSLSWVYLSMITVITFWTQLSHVHLSFFLSTSFLLFISGFQGQKCLLFVKLNLDLCHFSFQKLLEYSSCVGCFFSFHGLALENAIRHRLYRLGNQIALFSHMCQPVVQFCPQTDTGVQSSQSLSLM